MFKSQLDVQEDTTRVNLTDKLSTRHNCTPFVQHVFVLFSKLYRTYAISGFRRGVNEIFGLPRCYAAFTGRYLPTFRDNLSVPFSRMKQSLDLRERNLQIIPKRRKLPTNRRRVASHKNKICVVAVYVSISVFVVVINWFREDQFPV